MELVVFTPPYKQTSHIHIHLSWCVIYVTECVLHDAFLQHACVAKCSHVLPLLCFQQQFEKTKGEASAKNAPPSNFSRFTSEKGEKSKLGKDEKLKRRQLDKLVKVLAKLDWQMMVVWNGELFFFVGKLFSSSSFFAFIFKVYVFIQLQSLEGQTNCASMKLKWISKLNVSFKRSDRNTQHGNLSQN